MKFKITSSAYGKMRATIENIIEKYPQLKDKVEITDTFCKKENKTREIIIDINSLDELLYLADLASRDFFYRGIVVYKNFYWGDNNEKYCKIYDDIYTIEIYDDWRE